MIELNGFFWTMRAMRVVTVMEMEMGTWCDHWRVQHVPPEGPRRSLEVVPALRSTENGPKKFVDGRLRDATFLCIGEFSRANSH